MTNDTKFVKTLPFNQSRSRSHAMASHSVKMLLPVQALCPKDSRLRTKKAGRNIRTASRGGNDLNPRIVPRAPSLRLQFVLQRICYSFFSRLFAYVGAERLTN